MLSEPRTINWITELIHIPSKHPLEKLREVFNQVCNTCDYESFIRTPDGARIEQRAVEGNEVSSVTFRQDRIVIVEDNATMSLDQYMFKLDAVAKIAMEGLGIPVYLVQQNTVRAIASPNCFKTAAEFIGKTLFRIQNDDLALLGRPTSIFGLRLFFPATQESPHQFNVRVESYVKDPRSVYIENAGVFKTPIPYQSREILGTNMKLTADFVSTNICGFLSQFDRKETEL